MCVGQWCVCVYSVTHTNTHGVHAHEHTAFVTGRGGREGERRERGRGGREEGERRERGGKEGNGKIEKFIEVEVSSVSGRR